MTKYVCHYPPKQHKLFCAGTLVGRIISLSVPSKTGRNHCYKKIHFRIFWFATTGLVRFRIKKTLLKSRQKIMVWVSLVKVRERFWHGSKLLLVSAPWLLYYAVKTEFVYSNLVLWCCLYVHSETEQILILRLRITHLETELARRDQEFRAQKLQLQHIQRELEAKISQIDKLQDAIGYNNSLGLLPPGLCHHSHRCFSVINQGPSRFHRVAVEVHRRLKAKEGVSAEPTSENFCGGFRAKHISIAKAFRKDSQ